MLAIAVQFLTGRYVATGTEHRDAHEWPPHPARLFSALVATWADIDDPDPDERAALEWLETLPDPHIHASDATPRSVVTHFSPINDSSVVGLSVQQRRYERLRGHLADLDEELEAAGGDLEAPKVKRVLARIDKERDVAKQVTVAGNTPTSAALAVLPEGRGRQPRTYPSVTPARDEVVFVWPDAEPDQARRQALDRLLERVVRLGHSSSFVSCRLLDDAPSDTRFQPDADGSIQLRGVGKGQLRALERAHERHRASLPRSLPHRAARYSDRVEEPAPESATPRSVLSGQLLVFRRSGGARLPVTATVKATRALRGALMHHAAEPIPEELSGHAPGSSGQRTRPSERPHSAFLALPFVGHEHATGTLLGVGVLLPTDIDTSAREAILRAVGRWMASDRPGRLQLGRAGCVDLVHEEQRPDAYNLRRSAWARPSRSWATVTPIALDRHPGNLWRGDPDETAEAYERAAASIVQACRNVGLPGPAHVDVTLQSAVRGSRPARSFPGFAQGDGERQVRRALVHAEVTFAEPVAGPLLLGAGRYLGLGLLRPVDPFEGGR